MFDHRPAADAPGGLPDDFGLKTSAADRSRVGSRVGSRVRSAAGGGGEQARSRLPVRRSLDVDEGHQHLGVAALRGLNDLSAFHHRAGLSLNRNVDGSRSRGAPGSAISGKLRCRSAGQRADPRLLELHGDANHAGTSQQSRGVAQPGSAPASGAGGRRFESSRPDHSFQSASFPIRSSPAHFAGGAASISRGCRPCTGSKSRSISSRVLPFVSGRKKTAVAK